MTKTMTRNQIIIRPVGNSVYRRQTLHSSSSRGRIAEVAGGTAAECVAVWCCCPCTLVNLVVLAVYKLPAGICRKALQTRRRRQMMKKGLLPLSSSSSSSSRQSSCKCGYGGSYGGWDSDEFQMELGHVPECEEFAMVVVDKELVDIENEMLSKFYSTGFWRSPSRRE